MLTVLTLAGGRLRLLLRRCLLLLLLLLLLMLLLIVWWLLTVTVLLQVRRYRRSGGYRIWYAHVWTELRITGQRGVDCTVGVVLSLPVCA